MINRVVLVGRLTKNPEFRVTPSSVQVATFTLAVNRNYTKQNGEREADFINCVVFNKPAENVHNYLSKGKLVGVEGKIQTRNYKNSEDRTIYVTEIVCERVQFLEPKSNNQDYQQNEPTSYNSHTPEFDEADLPFD